MGKRWELDVRQYTDYTVEVDQDDLALPRGATATQVEAALAERGCDLVRKSDRSADAVASIEEVLGQRRLT